VSTLREKLRHAFAVDPPGPAEPSPEEKEAVEWFCSQVARRRLTTPGLIALEMSRPLNFIASQAMHYFAPGVWAVARQQTYEQYRRFAAFLERRGSIDYLESRIEELEREYENRNDGPEAPAEGSDGDTGGSQPG
jgi:hypothetical protein